MKALLIGFLLISIPLALHASPWKSELEAGYSQSRGNSNVESLYLSAKTQLTIGQYGAEGQVKLDRQATDGKLTKAYALINGKGRYYFSKQRSGYLFTSAQWEQDEPNGLFTSWSVTAGPGYQWTFTHKQRVSLEAGVGVQNSDYSENSRDYEGMVGSLFAAYSIPLNTAVIFKANTLSLANDIRHLNSTNFKVESTLAHNLSLNVGYEYRYNSKPDLGKKSEDTTLRLTLKYAF